MKNKNLKIFKIRVTPSQSSVQIQTTLLSLGYTWRSGDNFVKENYAKIGFLVEKDLGFIAFDRLYMFEGKDCTELTLDQLKCTLSNCIKYLV